MFRNYNKRKVIVLCLGLAAMTMLPQWASAQDNGGSGTQAWSGKSLLGRDNLGNGYSVSTGQGDGGSHAGSFVSLFGRQNSGRGLSSGSGYSIFVEQFGGENGGGTGGYNIGNEQFGNEGPLGSGLFIMAAAGAAYAFSKKRKKQENK